MEYGERNVVDFAEAYATVSRAVFDPCFPATADAMRREVAESTLEFVRQYESFPETLREKMTVTRDQVDDLKRRCETALGRKK